MYMKYHSQSISEIRRANGDIVAFDPAQAQQSIQRALIASAEGGHREAQQVVESVLKELFNIKKHFINFIPDVDGVQDLIERALITMRYVNTAKTYILWREERKRLSRAASLRPEVLPSYQPAEPHFVDDPLAQLIHQKYCAAWLPIEMRRETWKETVARYMQQMEEALGDRLKTTELEEVEGAILRREVLPSLAFLRSSGRASDSTNVCTYDYAYIAPTCLRDFADIMYVIMCGPSLTFSVEQQNVHQLPQIKLQTGTMLGRFEVDDNKESWCDALLHGMSAWYEGQDVMFDYGRCRNAGDLIKTLGGKSSGPEALSAILDFTRTKILGRQGARLQSIDIHDIICKIKEHIALLEVPKGEILALSDFHDPEIKDSRRGARRTEEVCRNLSYHAAVVPESMSSRRFLEEWLDMMSDAGGRRGFFNRSAIYRQLPKRRQRFLKQCGDFVNGRPGSSLGRSVHGEMILRSKQFGSCSYIVVSAEDTIDTLKTKAKLAALIGTFQTTFTEFPYLSPEWKKNCSAENNLGVSLTGDLSRIEQLAPAVFREIKQECVETNRVCANRFRVRPSYSVTSVCESEAVSSLCGYSMPLRRACTSVNTVSLSFSDDADPTLRLLDGLGLPTSEDDARRAPSAVRQVTFPLHPDKACQSFGETQRKRSFWLKMCKNFSEHGSTLNMRIGEDDWIEMAEWVHHHWSEIGTSFCYSRELSNVLVCSSRELEPDRLCILRNWFSRVNLIQAAHFEKNDFWDDD